MRIFSRYLYLYVFDWCTLTRAPRGLIYRLSNRSYFDSNQVTNNRKGVELHVQLVVHVRDEVKAKLVFGTTRFAATEDKTANARVSLRGFISEGS